MLKRPPSASASTSIMTVTGRRSAKTIGFILISTRWPRTFHDDSSAGAVASRPAARACAAPADHNHSDFEDVSLPVRGARVRLNRPVADQRGRLAPGGLAAARGELGAGGASDGG